MQELYSRLGLGDVWASSSCPLHENCTLQACFEASYYFAVILIVNVVRMNVFFIDVVFLSLLCSEQASITSEDDQA